MPTPKEQQTIKKLNAMTVDEARQAIASGQFGHSNSQDYVFASRWLSAKESSLRDEREEETLSIAKEANRIASNALIEVRSSATSVRKQARWTMYATIIATIAIIIAAIAARADIKWFISWIVSKL